MAPMSRALIVFAAAAVVALAVVAAVVLRADGDSELPPHRVAPESLSLPGGFVWRGDYETGDLSQWSGAVQRVADERIAIVEDPVQQGQFAARFEVRPGEDPLGNFGDRAEVQSGELVHEGDERWYEWSTFFPEDYPSEPQEVWQVFAQWHSVMEGVPPVSMEVSGDSIRLLTSRHDAEGNRLTPFVVERWSGPVERGRWRTFKLRVVWSGDDATGSVALWVDGEPVLKETSTRTMYPGSANFFKQGLYRCACTESTAVIYHDGMVATDAATE